MAYEGSHLALAAGDALALHQANIFAQVFVVVLIIIEARKCLISREQFIIEMIRELEKMFSRLLNIGQAH